MFHYLLVLADGEPADPGVFISSEPSGLVGAGQEFQTGNGKRWRILDVQAPPDHAGDGSPWAAEYNAVWTVEPI